MTRSASTRRTAPAVSRAFSLVDVLVTIAVISVLIGIMLPTIAGVRETTRKVVCASNARQHGLAVAMYADDYRGVMPPSRFAPKFTDDPTAQPAEMMLVRGQSLPHNGWDGLGVLFASNYLNAPGVYYCPSHRGRHPQSNYSDLWTGGPADISANYHYRGATASGSPYLSRFEPNSGIISDGLQTRWDLNHLLGANVIAADLRVAWIDDRGRTFEQMLANSASDLDANDKVVDAWQFIDEKLRQPAGR